MPSRQDPVVGNKTNSATAERRAVSPAERPRTEIGRKTRNGKNQKLHFVRKEELPWRYLTDAVDADVPAFVAFITGRPVGHGVQHLFGELLIERAAVQLAGAGCNKNCQEEPELQRGFEQHRWNKTDIQGTIIPVGPSLSKS